MARTAAPMTISIAVSSSRGPGRRPARVVLRARWGGRPAPRAATEGGVAAGRPRFGCAVEVLRSRSGAQAPGGSAPRFTSELKLPAHVEIQRICWCFTPSRAGRSLLRIVVPTGRWAQSRPGGARPRRRAGAALERADGVVRELELVALRTRSPSARSRSRSLDGGVGQAPREHGERRLELLARVALAERRLDVLAPNPRRDQPTLDPLAAPGVDRPAVLREALRVAGVVEVALATRARRPRRRRSPASTPSALEVPAQLEHRAVTAPR